MILQSGRLYLDSAGRKFEFHGLGKVTGFAFGHAYDPRPKRWKKKHTGYDDNQRDVDGGRGILICPYPGNDYHPSAFPFYQRGKHRGFCCIFQGRQVA